MTEWIYGANIIVTDQATGNAFASALDNDTGGADTFKIGLIDLGSNHAVPDAWFADVPLMQNGYDELLLFKTGGYPSTLTDAGYTEAQIDAARDKFTIDMGSISIREQRYQFIASNNYEILD